MHSTTQQISTTDKCWQQCAHLFSLAVSGDNQSSTNLLSMALALNCLVIVMSSRQYRVLCDQMTCYQNIAHQIQLQYASVLTPLFFPILVCRYRRPSMNRYMYVYDYDNTYFMY